MDIPPAIRLLVLDDHDVVRHGIVSMLEREPDMQVVAQARSAEHALRLHRSHKPDVALVDLRLSGVSGIEFVTSARRERPQSRFVILTTFDSDEDVRRAFSAGAQAYVLKLSARAEIVAAVRGVHAGRTMMSPEIVRRLRERENSTRLSQREVEVLSHVARGESNRNIGSTLGIGENTVKTHLVRVFMKLAVNGRTAAVAAAINRGIISL